MTLHSLMQLQDDQMPTPRLGEHSNSTNIGDGRSTSDIKHAAYIRLETLMRLWYLRHSFSSYDAWVTLFLTYLGNLALESLNGVHDTAPVATTEVFRSTVVLSINGLNSQSNCYYLGALISRAMIERLSADDAKFVAPHLSHSSVEKIEGPFDSEVTTCPEFLFMVARNLLIRCQIVAIAQC